VSSYPIVDAHHHIWRFADLPWLVGPPAPRIFGTYDAIRRDYSIEEYVAEATKAGVVRSVYVQTNWPPARALDEVAWVQSVAARDGFPHGIVGFADLAAPDVEETLDAMRAFPSVRGIRQQLHWHVKPLYRFAATRHGAAVSPRFAGAACYSSSRCLPGRWQIARGSLVTSPT
jgi:predicted TIM-barrel fold metal-dependent hydrolase